MTSGRHAARRQQQNRFGLAAYACVLWVENGHSVLGNHRSQRLGHMQAEVVRLKCER